MFIGGNIRIDGDALDNNILVSVSGGNVTLTGQDNTTINNQNGPLTLRASSDRIRGSFSVRLGDGDDSISVEGIAVNEMLRIFGGAGDDDIQVMNTRSRKLHVRGNEGDDVVDVQDVRTTKWTTVRLDAGNDVLGIDGIRAGKNISIIGDEGDDTVATNDMRTGRKLYFGLGDGTDQAGFFGETRIHRRADIGLGSGDDFLAILPDRMDDVASFRKRLKVWLGPGDDAFATDAGVRSGRLTLEGGRDTDTFSSSNARLGRQDVSSIESRELPDLEARLDALYARLDDVGIDPAPFGGSSVTEPLSVTLDTTPLDYSEGDGAEPIDPALTLTGDSTSNVTGATVAITSGYESGADVLSFSNQLGITGIFDASTGTLSLSGTASLANYQAALRSVMYENTSENPAEDTRTLTVSVEQGGESASDTRTLNVTAVADAPIVSLPTDTIDVDVQELPVILSTDATITDVDSEQLVSLTLEFSSGYQAGEDQLIAENLPTGITANFDASTGILTLSGQASLTDFQMALRAVSYDNLTDTPTTGLREITITADDGALTGSATLLLTLGADVAAPEISVSDVPLAYTEGDGAVAVDAQLTITDADSTMLVSATIEITDGFAASEDVLAFADQLGITGTYDPSTGTLTLSGMASLADYQMALRTVTYANTSEDPSEANRTLAFTVSDGFNEGGASRSLTVLAVNDPLSLVVPPEVPASSMLTIDLSDGPLNLTFGAEDLDDSAFVFQLDLEASGIADGDNLPSIDATTGEFSWTPSTAGTFAIRVLVVNESGQADQQVISIEVTDLGSSL